MSKERLEFKELDEHFKPKTELGEFMKKEVDNGNHCDGNIYWLISEKERQAERMRELEKERSEWKDTAQSYYMTNRELREQNKRYREALEEIARGRFSGASYKARKALGGEK